LNDFLPRGMVQFKYTKLFTDPHNPTL